MAKRWFFKKIVEHVPQPVGKLLSAVPFHLRFGRPYSDMRREAKSFKACDQAELKKRILSKLQTITCTAYRDTIFYKTIYQRSHYHPQRLTSIEHFADVPIVTKEDMREFGLAQRSIPSPGRMLINTGGTSGEPLAFYVDHGAFAREWAHMHLIWERAGYHYRDVKLTMRGRNLGEKLVAYNAVHNEYMINPYANRVALAAAVAKLLKREPVRWLHGYPSLISELLISLAKVDAGLIEALRRDLKGVLLGSEFPAPHYLEQIRKVAPVPVVAWYGHSEMSVLAYENGANRYVPMHSYGFVEAVGESSRHEKLIGTSYWNAASPFIRYDTGDLVSAEVCSGITQRFSIEDGRVGDFVLDSEGTRIALTALIFGRHHASFARIRHVQVRQRKPGQMDLLVVPNDASFTLDDLMCGFDFSHVELDVVPVLLEEPLRTSAGKIKLLV